MLGLARMLGPGRLALLQSLLLAAACDGGAPTALPPRPGPPTGAEPIQTEFAFYELATNDLGGLTATVRFTLHNASDSTLFVPVHCAGHGTRAPNLEKRVEGDWVTGWAAFKLACVTSDPLGIEPGALYADSVTMSRDVFLVDALNADGTFRLALDLFYDEEAVFDFTPQTVRYSNEFELEVR